MNKLISAIIILIGLLYPFSSFAQKIDLSQEIPFLQELELRNNNNKLKAILLPIERIESIQKLDKVFWDFYKLWDDKKGFEEFLSYASEEEKEHIKDCLPYLDQHEVNLLDIKRKEWTDMRKQLLFPYWESMVKYLNMNTNESNVEEIRINLSYVENHLTLQHLAFSYHKIMQKFPEISSYIKGRNLTLIKERLSTVEKEKYVFYRSLYSKPDALKSVSLYHDNDVFTFGGLNQDREYTGGGEITLTTDLLNTRWLNSGWLQNISRRRSAGEPKGIVMKYQSLSVGAEAYTPYIRYKDYTELADDIYEIDRPFASVFFVEKSTYRLWPKGLVRNKGQWRIGTIGTHQGNNVQAALHRDAITESQKVYGWDNQIANGGRLYIQTEQKLDLLLYSTNNEFKTIFKPNLKNTKNRKKIGANFISTNTLLYGGKITGLETGLKFSTVNFTQISGEQNLSVFKPNNIYKFAFSFEAGLNYRFVYHNSLLEDFGYLKTFADDAFDNEPVSSRFFNKVPFNNQENSEQYRYDRLDKEDDELNRHIFRWNVGINLRFRRSTLFFHMNYLTKEYKYDQNLDYISEYLDFYENEPTPFNNSKYITDLEDKIGKEQNEFFENKFYAYGTLGMVWLIED